VLQASSSLLEASFKIYGILGGLQALATRTRAVENFASRGCHNICISISLVPTMSKPDLPRALAAEFIAMTLFVWIGCGAAVSAQVRILVQNVRVSFNNFLTRPLVQAIDVFNDTSGTSAAFLTAVSLAFGTGITVLAYTIGPVSGE
jgi:hypothetical protein